MATKRDFKAIDFSVNAWFPGGIGARFAGIGLPGVGVCNSAMPWWGMPYSKNRHEETLRGWTPEFMIERMDRAGVEKSGLIACWATEGLGGKDCRVEVEEVYPVVNKYPDRFFGIVGISSLPDPTSKYYPPKYIRHAVQQLGFKAVHMYPHWFGIKINDKRFYPIYETCSALDVPFLFQTGTGTGLANSRVCGLPEWMDDVVRDFPTLKLVPIHPAGAWEGQLIDMVMKDPNVYWGRDAAPPSTWPKAGIIELFKEEHFFFRGPAMKEQHLRFVDKFMWGTDFPVQDWEFSLQEFDKLDLPEDVARKILRENAIRLFKL